MNIDLDQSFRLPSRLRSLLDAVTLDLHEPYHGCLSRLQRPQQSLEHRTSHDRLTMIWNPIAVIERICGPGSHGSDTVNPFIARYRGQPRAEGAIGIICGPLLVNGQQDVLNHVVNGSRRQPASVVTPEPDNQLA